MGGITPDQLHYWFEIEYPLSQFKQYALFIENLLKNEAGKNAKMAAQLNKEKERDVQKRHFIEIGLHESDFPTILRSSLLTSLYSFVENKLTGLCTPADSGKTFNRRNSGRKPLMSKAKDYLINELNVEFPIHLPAWTFIQNTNRIRNCFVHSGGDVSVFRSEQKLRNIINHMEHVTIDSRNKIILEKTFCLAFIEHAFVLFSALYQVRLEEL